MSDNPSSQFGPDHHGGHDPKFFRDRRKGKGRGSTRRDRGRGGRGWGGNDSGRGSGNYDYQNNYYRSNEGAGHFSGPEKRGNRMKDQLNQGRDNVHYHKQYHHPTYQGGGHRDTLRDDYFNRPRDLPNYRDMYPHARKKFKSSEETEHWESHDEEMGYNDIRNHDSKYEQKLHSGSTNVDSYERNQPSNSSCSHKASIHEQEKFKSPGAKDAVNCAMSLNASTNIANNFEGLSNQGRDHEEEGRSNSTGLETNDSGKPRKSSNVPDSQEDAKENGQYDHVQDAESPQISLTKEQLVFKELLKSQYKIPHLVECLPQLQAFDPDSPMWILQKEKAAEAAIDAVAREGSKVWKNEVVRGNSSDSDTSREYAGASSIDEYTSNMLSVKKFVEKVKTCYPLTTGFRIISFYDGADQCCYCPCSGFMKKWRQDSGVEWVVNNNNNNCNCRDAAMTPFSLMAHLRNKGGVNVVKNELTGMVCKIHYATRVYLENLYCMDGDYHGGVGHKALYQLKTCNYNKAESAERNMLRKEIQAGRLVIEQQKQELLRLSKEKKQHEEQMEELKKLNGDLYKKIKNFEEERDGLEIEKKPEEPRLTQAELDSYRNLWDTTTKVGRIGHRGTKLEVVIDCCASDWSLQSWLDKAYASKRNTNMWKALFERDLKNPGLVLGDWNVTFNRFLPDQPINNKKLLKQSIENAKHNDLNADDKGGPSRQLVSDCWKQLSELHVPGFKGAKLFETTSCGVIPVTDDKLKNDVEKTLKKMVGEKNGGCKGTIDENKVKKGIDGAMSYYFAIGRIIVHSMMTGMTIASSAMVPLYQNFLLRACSPKDPEYHKEDILKHTTDVISNKNLENTLRSMVGFPYEYENEGGETVKVTLNKKNIFSTLVYDRAILQRKGALGAMKDGLTLQEKDEEGKHKVIIDLTEVFRPMKLGIVQKLLFSRASLTVDDVIKSLSPKYDEGGRGWKGTEEARMEQRKKQERFFHGTFVPFLRKKGEEKDSVFLSNFVECCTGYNYLPCSEGCTINVEFNYLEPEPGCHPKFWSCNKIIVLPGYLYYDKQELFEQKMEETVEWSVGKFDMN